MWQTVESKADRGRCWRDMTAREGLKELSWDFSSITSLSWKFDLWTSGGKWDKKLGIRSYLEFLGTWSSQLPCWDNKLARSVPQSKWMIVLPLSLSRSSPLTSTIYSPTSRCNINCKACAAQVQLASPRSRRGRCEFWVLLKNYPDETKREQHVVHPIWLVKNARTL